MSEVNNNNPVPTPDNPTPQPQPPATPQGQQGGSSQGTENLITFTPQQLSERLERDFQVQLKRLLDSIGVDSLDSLKSTVTDAKQRKEADMSELEKLQSQLEAEQAKSKKASDELEALRVQRIADNRDARIKELAKEAGAVDVEDVLLNVQKDAATVQTLVDKDGNPDAKAIGSAINAVKTAKPHLFSANVPGVPSNKGGKPVAPDKDKLEAVKRDYMRRLRG